MEEHKDIEHALARPTRDDFDDSDLEQELAELLNDSTNLPPPGDGGIITSDLASGMEKVSLNLPEVPDASPDVSPDVSIQSVNIETIAK